MQRFSTWAMGLLVGLALLVPAHRASAQGYVVVVNEAGPASLTQDDLSRLFLVLPQRIFLVAQPVFSLR